MDRVSVVCDAWRAFPTDRAARLAAMTSRGISASDARRYAGAHQGEPCTKGRTAARDGCQPVNEKGKAIKQSGRAQRNIDRKKREKAREHAVKAVAEAKGKRTEAAGSVAKGRDLGPLEHARAVRDVVTKTGASPKEASAIVDRAQGKKAGDQRKRGIVEKAKEGAARLAAKEYDHYDHELEAAGVGGPGVGGKALRGAVLASLKVAMSVPGVPSALVGGVGTALGGLAYMSGADMVANMHAVMGAAKLSAKAVRTGAKLLSAARGKAA